MADTGDFATMSQDAAMDHILVGLNEVTNGTLTVNDWLGIVVEQRPSDGYQLFDAAFVVWRDDYIADLVADIGEAIESGEVLELQAEIMHELPEYGHAFWETAVALYEAIHGPVPRDNRAAGGGPGLQIRNCWGTLPGAEAGQ